ncbi:MAG: homoserine dehydrogenase [Acidimicrobiia bacterium]
MSIGIGIAGAGTVGGSLLRRLLEERAVLMAKTGLDLEVRLVAVRDTSKSRPGIPPELISDDVMALVSDPEVALVVEVMGGLEPAGDLVLASLRAGKPVITANKELIAARGPELFAAAADAGVPLLFEAAVGGGIPIIRPLTETLAGEQVDRVLGIVNGTTNYILTSMADEGVGYEEALEAAQRLGYAEPDPTADVSGADAAAKAAILAGLAFGTWVEPDRIHTEGITGITDADFKSAEQLGFAIRLLAVAERRSDGVSVRVHPVMLPVDHPLAAIRGATNAIYIEGSSVGELLFAGPGAGGEPTATAVLGDVIDAAREHLSGSQVAPAIKIQPGEVVDFGKVNTQWYLRLEVADSPGVLSQIASAFADAGVSLGSVRQEGRGDSATLVLVTHTAPEAAQQAAVATLRSLEVVETVASVIRVESEEA